MHYLLDTQVALWWLVGDSRLSEQKFVKRFKLTESVFIFHQVSCWEIEIKYDLGKLGLPKRPGTWIIDAGMQSGFDYRRIEDQAIFALGKLPNIHRDPFDRLLVAHCLVGNWTLITADQVLDGYPINVELL